MWSASSDKTIRVWSQAGEPLRVLEGHTGRVFTLLQDTPSSLWSGGWDTRIIVWNTKTYEVAAEFPDVHTDSITAMALSQTGEGNQVWVASSDGYISVWHSSQTQSPSPDPAEGPSSAPSASSSSIAVIATSSPPRVPSAPKASRGHKSGTLGKVQSKEAHGQSPEPPKRRKSFGKLRKVKSKE